MPDSFGKYSNMNVVEYLDFFARAYGFRGQQRRDAVERVLVFTELRKLADKPIVALSKGMSQRLGLGRTLIHDPQVLILDEPAAGLDPRARVELRELIRLLASEMKKTVLISSHILTELGEICDSAAIIEAGRNPRSMARSRNAKSSGLEQRRRARPASADPRGSGAEGFRRLNAGCWNNLTSSELRPVRSRCRSSFPEMPSPSSAFSRGSWRTASTDRIQRQDADIGRCIHGDYQRDHAVKRQLVIDADPGIGDALAVALAMLDPTLDVVGLTSVAGRVGGEMALRNLQGVAALLDPPRWPRIRRRRRTRDFPTRRNCLDRPGLSRWRNRSRRLRHPACRSPSSGRLRETAGRSGP